MHQDIERTLFSEAEIAHAVSGLGDRIDAHFGATQLCVLAVLKGSCVFLADLIRRLPQSLELQFAQASSYRDGTHSGELEFSFFPSEADLVGRDILIVDDILDTGRTMARIVARCEDAGASSVRTCVLLDKPARRQVEMDADWKAFKIEDLFVVGYGLDFAGRYRNLPYIGCLRAEIVAAGPDGHGTPHASPGEETAHA